MIRTALAATALLAATPALAQSTTQERIDARYDRALAAGYKALFLCSAVFNAERNGATRTPESVEKWELSGIQSPLDGIVSELRYSIDRKPILDGQQVTHSVRVWWDEEMAPRIAIHNNEKGCFLTAMGGPQVPFVAPHVASTAALEDSRVDTRLGSGARESLSDVAASALGEESPYGDGTRTTAVLVQREGAGLIEMYHPDFAWNVPQRTWSVAKSIAATLLGEAVHRGEVDVSDSAGLGFGKLGDPRHTISIDDAIRMASGRYSDTPGNRTDALYFGGATVTEVALDWPLVNPPGTVFRYANNDTLAAVQAISEGFEESPPSDFFAKLGMHHTVAETDWKGNYILSSQVWSTARDLARIGNLYLDDGILPSGERILPADWAEYVSTPSGPQPDGPFGYGAGFWLFNKSEGIPSDTFAAMGNRGQFIVIVPSLNVVIVRRGEDPAGSRFDIASFTRDVLESLEK
ncbi:beta-lactamase family protein [Qipengyuania aquimaris]|uniref:serine hydrolase domain-containing protein n=1 Tax=Qipengyuania aquimaris TaxID=255984 RepID=UPI001C97C9AB|nr:serine hydrolase [Qipengyuania aquimaris]MBY6128516.1 beta-lactamase family protein [Qipengyuania aquimaris]